MSILRKAFKIFNGSSWDEYHLKTDSKQVVHTKADGTDTTVEEQLLALSSTMKVNKISLGTKCGVTATCYYNDFMCEIDMEGKTTGTFTAWTGYQFDRLPLAKLYPGRDLVEYFPYHTEFYMEITPGGLVNMNAKQNVSTTGIAVQCSKVFMLAN